MSKDPLWHPATWPFPSAKRKTFKHELAHRARTLISREGEYVRDPQDDIVCQAVYLKNLRLRLYLWWHPRRIEVFANNRKVLEFNASGLVCITDDETAKEVLDVLRRLMILSDLANA